jgi:hypothetical protein
MPHDQMAKEIHSRMAQIDWVLWFGVQDGTFPDNAAVRTMKSDFDLRGRLGCSS